MHVVPAGVRVPEHSPSCTPTRKHVPRAGRRRGARGALAAETGEGNYVQDAHRDTNYRGGAGSELEVPFFATFLQTSLPFSEQGLCYYKHASADKVQRAFVHGRPTVSMLGHQAFVVRHQEDVDACAHYSFSSRS